MRLVIDLQGAQSASRVRGIGRHSMALALAMARQAGADEVWVVLNALLGDSARAVRHAFAGLVPADRIRVFSVAGPVGAGSGANAWRAAAAERTREWFIASLRPDAVLVTSLFEGFFDDAVTSLGTLDGPGAEAPPTAVVLYDLIPLQWPERYLDTPLSRAHYDAKIASLRRANTLLAISQYSRRQALELLNAPPESVVSIGSAVAPQFRPLELSPLEAAELRQRLGIRRDFVMYAPGGFDERKNIARLIEAYAMLGPALRARHQLVVTGTPPEPERERMAALAAGAGLQPHELILTGRVADQDLIALYGEAALFVFPSLYEGFGLPALEAMACGAPVIGSNTTSIPEVIGLSEALFDPADAASISACMTRALDDAGLRQRLRAHGLERARAFSWDQCAARAWEALRAMPVPPQSVGRAAPTEEQSLQALVNAIALLPQSPQPAAQDLAHVASCVAFSMRRPVRQLLVDISTVARHDVRSGIQRVVRSVLRALVESPPQGFEVLPVYLDGGGYRYADAFLAAMRGQEAIWQEDRAVEFCNEDVYLGLDLTAHLMDQSREQYRDWARRGMRLYFVVYDILPTHRPDWWPANVGPIFGRWLDGIAEVATGLACISEAVARDVRHWLDAHRPDCAALVGVQSFHLGSDLENSLPTRGLPPDAATVLGLLGERVSFLMLGTVEPRKGHAQALAAFELLWLAGVDANLVVVGGRGWLVDELAARLQAHPENGRRLFWIEGASDEYLEAIFAASACLLAPSEGEGFGLPLVEAAQRGLPVLARNLAVFSEVAGPHASYFSGLQPRDLAQAVMDWLRLREQGRLPRVQDMPRLTWRESAAQLLHVLELPASAAIEDNRPAGSAEPAPHEEEKHSA